MTTTKPAHSSRQSLPYHRLVAYEVALELAQAVSSARIADAVLREQARKSARSCALNIAEATGRQSVADKSRVFAIALGEACEAAAALEIAVALRAASAADAARVVALAVRIKNLLGGLMR